MSTLINLMKKQETKLVILMIILSSLSFGLGYLYAKQETPSPIIIQKVIAK